MQTVTRSLLLPGLRELAEQESLTDEQIKKLTDAWYTIRGRKPRTVEEWTPLYRAVKPYLDKEK